MVERRAQGWTVPAIAAAAGISVRRVYAWLRRHREEGAAGLENRPSIAHRRPHAVPAPWAAMIEQLRRLRLTALEIAERLTLARSTVSGVLARLGLGRLSSLEPAEPPRRYERKAAGEILHLDTKKLGRFNRMGHRVTGDRQGQSNSRGVGWEFVHLAIDDFSRAAYVEVLEDELGVTCAAFLGRARRWFLARGVRIERVMSDNGSGYKSHVFARACRAARARHIRTRPYTPKTNGKAERFVQTLLREWAYAMPYPSSAARAADLPRWLGYYNSARPHGSLGKKPPVSRLPQPA
jgi:transposase InsO family protein